MYAPAFYSKLRVQLGRGNQQLILDDRKLFVWQKLAGNWQRFANMVLRIAFPKERQHSTVVSHSLLDYQAMDLATDLYVVSERLYLHYLLLLLGIKHTTQQVAGLFTSRGHVLHFSCSPLYIHFNKIGHSQKNRDCILKNKSCSEQRVKSKYHTDSAVVEVGSSSVRRSHQRKRMKREQELPDVILRSSA